jgi:Tfp pilus assembly protein PilV
MARNVWDQQIDFAEAAMRNDCFWYIVSCFLSIENGDAIVDCMKSKSDMVRGTLPSLGTETTKEYKNIISGISSKQKNSVNFTIFLYHKNLDAKISHSSNPKQNLNSSFNP